MAMNSRKPEAHDLIGLDSFDLAFLRLTNNVCFVPLDHFIVNVLKSSKAVVGWGPQAKLMGAVLRKSWNEHVGTMLEDVVDSFDTGKLEVDEKKISLILGSKKFKTLGSKVWASSEKKVLQLIAMTEEQAYKHFMNQRKEVEKAQTISTLPSVMGSKIGAVLDSYPVGTLDPEIGRLVTLAKTAPNLRTIDKVDIVRRIEGIEKLPTKYLNNMSDVSTGRVWSMTGMNMAASRGVATYQIIANITRTTCKVCERVDGSTFTVGGARTEIDNYLEGGEEIRFVRFSEVDNLSPEQMSKKNIVVPLHPSCRCNTVFLWKSAGIVKAKEGDADLKKAVYYGKLDSKQTKIFAKQLKEQTPDVARYEIEGMYRVMLEGNPNDSFYAMRLPIPGRGDIIGSIVRVDEALTVAKGALRVEGMTMIGGTADEVSLITKTLVRGMVQDEIALRGMSKARKIRFANYLLEKDVALEMGMIKKKGQWVLDQDKFKALLSSDKIIKPPMPVKPRPPRPKEITPKPEPKAIPKKAPLKEPPVNINKEAKRIDALPDKQRIAARRQIWEDMSDQGTKEYTVARWDQVEWGGAVDDGLMYIKTEDLLDLKKRNLRIVYNDPDNMRVSSFGGHDGVLTIISDDMRHEVSDSIAHELGHAIDSAWCAKKSTNFVNDFGYWANGSRVTEREAAIYRKWYHSHHTGEVLKGSYKNNWIHTYDGRVYKGAGVAEEWWAMNCARYNTYLLQEAKFAKYLDDLITKFPDGIPVAELKSSTMGVQLQAALKTEKSVKVAIQKLALQNSKWGMAQNRYPDLTRFIEKKFEGSRVKFPAKMPTIVKKPKKK